MEPKKSHLLGTGIVIVSLILLVGLTGWLHDMWQSSQKDRTVKVVISMPAHFVTGEILMNAVQLAFEEIGYQIGKTTVELVLLDDGDEQGAWQPDLERKNAEQAIADPSVVAYIGTYNSGAAKVSMPLLNQAGIVQISPGNTWPGLTKPGFFPGEPGTFYPTGVRHYVRVVTTDDNQGPAAAIWAQSLGFDSVYIVDDGEAYGAGIANLFKARAGALGIQLQEHATIDKTSTDFSQTVTDIVRQQPELVYYGGTTANGITHLVRQLRDAGYHGGIMGPDGIADQDFIDRTGAQYAEGVYSTTVGVPADKIGTPAADRFYQAYMQRFDQDPGSFGPYGYEAAQVVIQAIANTRVLDRDHIREEVKQTKSFQGLFTPWSFDANGDTSLVLISGQQVQDGRLVYIETLEAN